MYCHHRHHPHPHPILGTFYEVLHGDYGSFRVRVGFVWFIVVFIILYFNSLNPKLVYTIFFLIYFVALIIIIVVAVVTGARLQVLIEFL